MRAVILTSNGPRHAYLAGAVASRFDVRAVIREPKGAYYDAQAGASTLVAEHFRRLAETEHRYFGASRWPAVPTVECPRGEINQPELTARMAAEAPDVVVLFGTGILNDLWLSTFPDRIVNLHLGLSPYYRGAATLFWPIARGEVDCVGATIHLAAPRVDAGRILARVKPRLAAGDSYYDINYKTIRTAIDALPAVAEGYLQGKVVPINQDLGVGRVFRKRDFTEEALRAALHVIGDGLTALQIAEIERSARCGC